jgi:hypothetical protein
MPNSHSPRRQRNWEPLFAHVTKKGPRRYHRQSAETRARSELRKDADTRNPVDITERPHPLYQGETIRKVVQLPVRMKLPRLRRLGNK